MVCRRRFSNPQESQGSRSGSLFLPLGKTWLMRYSGVCEWAKLDTLSKDRGGMETAMPRHKRFFIESKSEKMHNKVKQATSIRRKLPMPRRRMDLGINMVSVNARGGGVYMPCDAAVASRTNATTEVQHRTAWYHALPATEPTKRLPSGTTSDPTRNQPNPTCHWFLQNGGVGGIRKRQRGRSKHHALNLTAQL